MEPFETWPVIVTLKIVTLKLRPHETAAVVGILKAHLEHCRKIKPDAVGLIQTLNAVIARIEEQQN